MPLSLMPGKPGQVQPPDASVDAVVDLRNNALTGDSAYIAKGHMLHAWQQGEYVPLVMKPGDAPGSPSGPVYWDGNSWQEGIAPAQDATIINEGSPGSFGPPGATLTSLGMLRANPYFGDVVNYGHTAWTPGEYVVLGDGSEAFWDGVMYQAGRAGAPVGTPTPHPDATGIDPPAAGTKEWTWVPANAYMPPPRVQEALQRFKPPHDFDEGDYIVDVQGKHYFWTHHQPDTFRDGEAPVKVDAVIAGSPGQWMTTANKTGGGVLSPTSVADAQATVLPARMFRSSGAGSVGADSAAWHPGEYVELYGGAGEIFWDGTAWQAGRAGAPVATPTVFAGLNGLTPKSYGNAPLTGVYQGTTQLWP